jgi:phosphohistidine swiveling domain-containing protein
MTQAIYPFSTQQTPQLSEVGGKAQSLIRSTQAGFPVPEGLALSVAFFQPWTEVIKSSAEWSALLTSPIKDNCDAVKNIAEKLTLTDAQRSQLTNAMEELKGCSVFAVRSSSPEEDLEGSSFAGMYETYLGTTYKALEQTIARAYSSMLDFRVMEYKAQQQIKLENSCISLIIQRQVASDVSGVGFSLNPMNNCFDEAVINASFGLGEAIVSGIVTPDSYVVEKVTMEILEKTVNDKQIAQHLAADGGIETVNNLEPEAQALSDEQILELTALIKKCEQTYQLPIDTEWAFENRKLYLLQSRPITSYVPLFPELMTRPGERKKLYMDVIPLTQGFDEPLSVLGADVWAIVLDRLKSVTLPAGEEGYVLNLQGRQYFLLHNMYKGTGKKLAMSMVTTLDNAFEGREEEIYNEYVAHELTEPMKQSRKAMLMRGLSMLPRLIKVLFDSKKEAVEFDALVISLTKKFKAMDCDRPFDQLVGQAFDDFQKVVDKMGIYFVGILANRKIVKIFKGTEVEDLVDCVLMDLPSNPTSAMGHAMFTLASSDEFKATVDAAEFEQRLADRSYPENFLTAWDDYIYKFGDRGFKEIDVASKRTVEKIDEFFIQLKGINLDNNHFLKVKERKEEALTKLRAVAQQKGKLKAFNTATNHINQTYGYRETPKSLVVIMNGNLHRVALQLGVQFVSQGRLLHREQIFDLHMDQVGQAQRDESLPLLPLIEENLKPYKQMQNVKQFPCFIDSRGKIIRKVIEAKDGELSGLAVSNGVIQGKAKVLMSPYEKPLKPGEILVTVATEPAWTPVFVNAAGVVLEVGGGLQHGAIIAREYGIPCVSGLPGVTDLIKDGDLLEVDGTNGIVRIVETA